MIYIFIDQDEERQLEGGDGVIISSSRFLLNSFKKFNTPFHQQFILHLIICKICLSCCNFLQVWHKGRGAAWRQVHKCEEDQRCSGELCQVAFPDVSHSLLMKSWKFSGFWFCNCFLFQNWSSAELGRYCTQGKTSQCTSAKQEKTLSRSWMTAGLNLGIHFEFHTVKLTQILIGRRISSQCCAIG